MSRLIDRGAQFAGWVGVGTAVVVVLAFALILTIQTVVFVIALPVGGLIGWYANVRADRRRPAARALLNALWAGALTGLALAVFYVGIRLLFIYADAGYPNFNRTDPATGEPIPPFCQVGPDCTLQRYLAEGRGEVLAAAGVRDAASFERFMLAEQAGGGMALFGLTLAGAAVAGAWRALAPSPKASAGASQSAAVQPAP